MTTLKADFPSHAAFAHAAWLLRCEIPAMEAFAKVEAGPEGAFLDAGGRTEPVILFERHVFRRLTGGRFDAVRVKDAAGKNLSVPWALVSDSKPSYLDKSYGPSSQQHRRLQAAVACDRDAALQSASWGLFQIMGFNHATCGYPELQRFITAMYREVDDHLRAFVMFIRHNEKLTDALREKNWPVATDIYNGRDGRKNGYHLKLAKAYEHFAKGHA